MKRKLQFANREVRKRRYDYHLAEAIRSLLLAEKGYLSTDFPEGIVTDARRIADEVMEQEEAIK